MTQVLLNLYQDTQQQNLAFYLTQEQANMVNMGRKVESNGMVVYKIHILLRFTRMSADSVQDDDFPKNLCLKVNNKVSGAEICINIIFSCARPYFCLSV